MITRPVWSAETGRTLPSPPSVTTKTWSRSPSPLKSRVLTTGPKSTESEVTYGTAVVPAALRRSIRYSQTHIPAAGEPGCAWWVRDCRKPPPQSGAEKSSTVTEHEGAKTQFTAGAPTSTICSGTARAAPGAIASAARDDG